MKFSTHYLNEKTGYMACTKKFNCNHAWRDYTTNKDEVTCKQCIKQIDKWEQIKGKINN